MLKYSTQIDCNFGLCQIHSAGTIAVESQRYYFQKFYCWHVAKGGNVGFAFEHGILFGNKLIKSNTWGTFGLL